MRILSHSFPVRLLFAACSAATIGLGSVFALPATATAASTKLIAVTGDPTPDGSGSLILFKGNYLPRAVLNDAGQVAFIAQVDPVDPNHYEFTGAFFGDSTALVQVAGVAEPDLDNEVLVGNFVSLNDAGQAAFLSVEYSLLFGPFEPAIVLADGGPLFEVVRTGDSSPDNMGEFVNIGPRIALNDAGETAFWARLSGTGAGDGIFRGDGSTLTQIAWRGQAAPDGDGTFSRLNSVLALNDSGQVAFRGFMLDSTNSDGIFLGDGSTIVQIARKNQPTLHSDDTFSAFIISPALNDAGQVAFHAILNNATGMNEGEGIFLGDGTTLTQVGLEGQAAPDGNGIISNFDLATPALNNAGQLAFQVSLSNTLGGSADNSALYLGDGTTLVKIAREGQLAPGGGTFFNFSAPVLNDAGQAAFLATLAGTSGGTADNQGIYFFDELLGLIEVARKGDSLLGSSIVQLSFETEGAWGDEGNGFNEGGLPRIAYGFRLEDGRGGVALWSLIPEPSSLMLIGTATISWAAFGRRRKRLRKAAIVPNQMAK